MVRTKDTTRLDRLIKTLEQKYEADPDPYRLGLLNGAILAQAVVKDIIPIFKHDRPKYGIPMSGREMTQ